MTRLGVRLVHLELSEPVPIEAAAGSEIVLRLRASCPAGCDRRGMQVRVTAPDGSQAACAFAAHDSAVSETGDIVLQVPPRVGEHVWRFVLPAHEIAGTRYGESAIAVPVRARPQTTSLAVWAVPSPLVTGERFAVKVGAKSSADCDLRARGVQIHDSGGNIVALGALGDSPWPGTAALYWTELELVAPAEQGIGSWTVQFEASGLDIPHEGTGSTFSAAIVRPPEHRLTVKVVERGTANPVEEALVRLGAYRAETGRSGLAEICLPKGRYELRVWKVGYDIAPTTLDLDKDVSIQIEALAAPEDDPDAIWKM